MDSVILLTDKLFSYSHASLYYADAEEVSKVLKINDLKLMGKKIYAFPAHKSYLSNVPDVSCVSPIICCSFN